MLLTRLDTKWNNPFTRDELLLKQPDLLAMIDYSIFYYQAYSSPNDLSDYDIFISAYNSSERVKSVFSNINASKNYG